MFRAGSCWSPFVRRTFSKRLLLRYSKESPLLVAIAIGKYPRILLFETGTNRLAIREITRLRFTLFGSLGVFLRARIKGCVRKEATYLSAR